MYVVKAESRKWWMTDVVMVRWSVDHESSTNHGKYVDLGNLGGGGRWDFKLQKEQKIHWRKHSFANRPDFCSELLSPGIVTIQWPGVSSRGVISRGPHRRDVPSYKARKWNTDCPLSLRNPPCIFEIYDHDPPFLRYGKKRGTNLRSIG
jgi:hypothetical protein